MTTSLTKAELQDCLDILSEGIEELETVKSEVKDKDKFNNIYSYQLQLESLEGEIILLIIGKDLNQLNTDAPDSPGAKIVAATKKLNEANDRLAELDKFLDLLENLVNLFGAIVNAIKTSSLASIDNILKAIEQL